MIAASDYLEKILSAFKFSEKKSYCQIATVEKTETDYVPKARTVLLCYDTQCSLLYFTCSSQTQKWEQLTETPKVTGIYLESETVTQYRFEADAKLISSESIGKNNFYETAWHNIRPSLRETLWREYLADENATYDINTICPNHGVVILRHYYWDIFHLDQDNFSKSERTQMILKNGDWQIFTNTPIIHPLNLFNQ